MQWHTHSVFNQPTPLNNSNLFLSERALRDAVLREGAGWDAELLASLGQPLGSVESLELGRLANVNPPELLRDDVTGARLDDVRFHPAWHLLLQGLCANRVHNLAWTSDPHPQPALLLFVANKRPHFVNFADQLNLEIVLRKCGYTPRREFFKVRTTALMLICNARSVSRMQALFIARSTICSFKLQ